MLGKVLNPYAKTVAAIIGVALVLLLPLLVGLQQSMLTPTMHLDGSFQTASGLFRLAAGESPGKDFNPYLGIGPLLALFPVFLLAGAKLSASVFAANFVTLLFAEIAFGLLFWLLFRSKSWIFALYISLIPALLILGTPTFPGLHDFYQRMLLFMWPSRTDGTPIDPLIMATPGNSLRFIRAFAPYLLVLLVLTFRKISASNRAFRWIGYGFLAGTFSTIWSNDFAAVTAFCFLSISIIWIFISKNSKLSRLLYLCLGAVLGLIIPALIITRGFLYDQLYYSYHDVRIDQSWYFSSWNPKDRIYNFSTFFNALKLENVALPILLVLILTVTALWKRDLRLGFAAFIGISLFAGGSVASIGGHIGEYYFNLNLWATLSLGILTFFAIKALVNYRLSQDPSSLESLDRLFGILVGIGIVSATLATSIQQFQQYESRKIELRNDKSYFFSQELGGYLPTSYSELVAAAKSKDQITVEEYFGISSSISGPQSGLKVDSVIHALGDTRNEFERFTQNKATKVITSAPSLGEWVAWGVSANWWMYEDLFVGWLPEESSPTTLTWKKAAASGSFENTACNVSGNNKTVGFMAIKSGLYSVGLRYNASQLTTNTFTMVQNNINYVSGANGYLALNPTASFQQIPVWVENPGHVELRILEVPNAATNKKTTFEGCSAAKVNFPEGSKTEELYAPLLSQYSENSLR